MTEFGKIRIWRWERGARVNDEKLAVRGDDVEGAGGWGTGHVELEIFIGEPGLHLAPHAIPDSRAQKSSHGIGPDDLLWDGDGETRGSALE